LFIRCNNPTTSAFSEATHDCFFSSLAHCCVITLNESFIAVVVHFTSLSRHWEMSSSKKQQKIVIFIREWKIVLCELFTIFSAVSIRSANAAKLLPYISVFSLMCANENKELSCFFLTSNYAVLYVEMKENEIENFYIKKFTFFFHLDVALLLHTQDDDQTKQFKQQL
jgi:hypothetical protein